MPEVLGTSKSIFGFDPRSIGGCVVWLDGQDTVVKGSSSTVTVWSNKGSAIMANGTGTANTLTPGQIGTEGGITLKAPSNVLTGVGGLSFTNSGSVGNNEVGIGAHSGSGATTGSNAYPLFNLPTQASTLFVAMYPTSNDLYRSPIMVESANLNAPMMWVSIEVGVNSGGIIGQDYNGASWPQLMQPASGQYSTSLTNRVDCMITGPNNAMTYGLWTNGTQQSATYGSNYLSTLSNYPINQIFIGAFTSSVWGNRNFYGTIYEVLLYDSALIDTQRQAVEGYLAWKYGFQSNLTSGHPYLSRTVFAKTFSPMDISAAAVQPRCWFDAADASKLVLSGSSVTTWSNKAGYANAGSAVGTVTNGGTTLNGTPGIRFAAGTSYLSIGSITYTTSYRNLFMVVAMPAASANTSTFLSANDAIGGQCYSYGPSNDLEFNKSGTLGFKVTSPTSFFSATSIVSICSARGDYVKGSVQGIWINGTLQTLATNGITSNTSFWSTGATSALTLGGASATTGSQLDVYEIIQYDGSISMAQCYQIEGYLAWKWGLTSNLPAAATSAPLLAAHPFKTFPSSSIHAEVVVVSGWVVNLDPTTFTSGGSSWTSTTSGNTWTAYNAPTTTSTPGGSSAVVFNGTTQYVMDQTGISVGPANSSSYTIDIWFYAAGSVSGNLVSEMGQSGLPASGWNVTIMYLSSNTIYAAFWKGSVYSLSLGSYSANTWTHACYTYSGTSVIGYVNGVQVSTDTATKQNPGTGYYCLAGGGNPYSTQGAVLACRIGSYRCYATTLTATQVKQNYNALCARFGLSPI